MMSYTNQIRRRAEEAEALLQLNKTKEEVILLKLFLHLCPKCFECL
ncbi:unnamed protein product [Brassica oleracea var. botrytis]